MEIQLVLMMRGLKKRYNSKNEEWCGEHRYFKIYDKLVSWGKKDVE